MDQETSGADPVCRFVFQMNLNSIVFCSYSWLLKDSLCWEYGCSMVLGHGNNAVSVAFFILRKTNGKQADATRKDITKTFKDLGFQIDTQCNLKQVNFLDITFNLSTATYHPFKKENDKLLYTNTSSKHPPTVIDQIPKSIGKRLSDNYFNERIFEDTKPDYQNALKAVETHQTSHTQINNQTITRIQEQEKDQLFGSTPHSTKAYKQT